MTFFERARQCFHRALLERVLFSDKAGVPTNADKDSLTSVKVATAIVERLGGSRVAERLAGQMSGNKFEELTFDFLHESFPKLDHLRPGNWEVKRISGRSSLAIAKFEQYSHLVALNAAARKDPELAAALGNDYTITPDVIIVRQLESDEAINFRAALVDESLARRASLRAINGGLPLLHASISCKWTMRSDRAQNARSEALNLIRNRKGHLPHVVVVTGEPLPTRLASLALGTGDIDCVYHFALPELLNSLEVLRMDDQLELLLTMVNGKRLKDIADLPLDLAV